MPQDARPRAPAVLSGEGTRCARGFAGEPCTTDWPDTLESCLTRTPLVRGRSGCSLSMAAGSGASSPQPCSPSSSAAASGRIGEMFDLIAGTSTGGILALGLTTPDPAKPGRAPLPRRGPRRPLRGEGARDLQELALVPIAHLSSRSSEASTRSAASRRPCGRTSGKPASKTRSPRSSITSYDLESRDSWFLARHKARETPTAISPSARSRARRRPRRPTSGPNGCSASRRPRWSTAACSRTTRRCAPTSRRSSSTASRTSWSSRSAPARPRNRSTTCKRAPGG